MYRIPYHQYFIQITGICVCLSVCLSVTDVGGSSGTRYYHVGLPDTEFCPLRHPHFPAPWTSPYRVLGTDLQCEIGSVNRVSSYYLLSVL